MASDRRPPYSSYIFPFCVKPFSPFGFGKEDKGVLSVVIELSLFNGATT